MATATTSGKAFNHETIYHTGYRNNPGTPSVDRAGVELMIGTITIQNSIIDDTNGPSICALSGATVNLSYSDTYRWRNDPRSKLPHGTYCYSTSQHSFGTVRVGSGVIFLDPKYVTDPDSPDFLVVGPTSPLINKSSSGGRLGALSRPRRRHRAVPHTRCVPQVGQPPSSPPPTAVAQDETVADRTMASGAHRPARSWRGARCHVRWFDCARPHPRP